MFALYTWNHICASSTSSVLYVLIFPSFVVLVLHLHRQDLLSCFNIHNTYIVRFFPPFHVASYAGGEWERGICYFSGSEDTRRPPVDPSHSRLGLDSTLDLGFPQSDSQHCVRWSCKYTWDSFRPWAIRRNSNYAN